MTAVVQPRQKLKREIDIYGVRRPVILTFSGEGIEFRIKGTRKTVRVTWPGWSKPARPLRKPRCSSGDVLSRSFRSKPPADG